jgi:hypothetical protein
MSDERRPLPPPPLPDVCCPRRPPFFPVRPPVNSQSDGDVELMLGERATARWAPLRVCCCLQQILIARRHAREHQRHGSDDGDGDVELMLGARATARWAPLRVCCCIPSYSSLSNAASAAFPVSHTADACGHTRRCSRNSDTRSSSNSLGSTSKFIFFCLRLAVRPVCLSPVAHSISEIG